MSKGKTHRTFFLLAYVILSVFLVYSNFFSLETNLRELLLGGLLGYIGSSIPDVDSRSSNTHRNFALFFAILILVSFIGFYFYSNHIFTVLGISSSILLISILSSKHRAFFHSLRFLILTTSWVALGFYFASYAYWWFAALAWAFGFFTHLLLDKKFSF